MMKIEYKVNQELKQITHFNRMDSPMSVVSNKRDHGIRQDLRHIAHDARDYGVGVMANKKGDFGKWTNDDIKQIVNYYKSTGLTDATIINYVLSLRSFLLETKRTNITASNSELGLKRVIEYKDKSLEAKGIDINEKLQYFKEKDANVYVQLKSNSIKNAGFNMHAVRHSIAQERYAELVSNDRSEKNLK